MMKIESISQTITRPGDTTAYASGDLVANSTTAGSVTPFQFYIPYGRGLELSRASVSHSTTTVTAATFRLHLYRDSPTVANGDNGAISSSVSNYQGFIDIDGTAPAMTGGGRGWGQYVSNSLVGKMSIITDVDQLLFGLLEARGAYAPGNAETFYVTLIGDAYV